MKIWLQNESYCNVAISIWEKSMLIEVSDVGVAELDWVWVLLSNDGECDPVGCLIASTLQFKLFSALLWAPANLYTYI